MQGFPMGSEKTWIVLEFRLDRLKPCSLESWKTHLMDTEYDTDLYHCVHLF